MSNPNTIARPEIAKLLEISVTKLINIIRYTNAKVPEPIGMSGHQLVYDRKITLSWIATKPLKNITWQQRAKKPSKAEQTAELARTFLSGNIGVSKAQRNRNQLRKLAAKHTSRPTQSVPVAGCDDYNGTRNAWAGLV
ncbi:MAG: hypothetical protein M0R47_20915 [Methylobacter sp.]|uniref:hypothetical protein n=1 Tax=Methylobacter sp. TaxID=2051955 RepID=UPI0025D33918|nr:hypothetical protein [Methylobacter sp.]MCK9622985.1 hypothetical protein [Methylobacter sp.]